jgi:hypothetical protein
MNDETCKIVPTVVPDVGFRLVKNTQGYPQTELIPELVFINDLAQGKRLVQN